MTENHVTLKLYLAFYDTDSPSEETFISQQAILKFKGKFYSCIFNHVTLERILISAHNDFFYIHLVNVKINHSRISSSWYNLSSAYVAHRSVGFNTGKECKNLHASFK